MTPEEREVKLKELIAEWQETKEISDKLSETFLEMIESEFERGKFKALREKEEIRTEFISNAYLMCCLHVSKYTPKVLKNGDVAKANSYVRTIIRSSFADTWMKEANYKKFYQNES